jgi:hypothetical protein
MDYVQDVLDTSQGTLQSLVQSLAALLQQGHKSL